MSDSKARYFESAAKATFHSIYGLFMEAIRFCAEHSLSLDFEGSMDKKIEHSFRAFGAQLVPYFQVSKSGNRWLEAGGKY